MDSAQYAELFLTESREHVSAINHSLLALERGEGGTEPVGAIFRSVHTIKGMSATMGYVPVAALSHELETLLDHVRQGRRAIDPALMDLLFRSADLLEAAIEGSVTGESSAIDVEPLVAALRSAASVAGAGGVGAGAAAARPVGAAMTEGAAALGEWTAEAPAGDGVLVRVRLDPETPLKGVRGFLVLQAAGAQGRVEACSPTADAVQRGDFAHDFAFRLVTTESVDTVAATLRRAGDVIEVQIGEDPAPRPFATPPGGIEMAETDGATGAFPVSVGGAGASPATAGARTQRSVRIDLRRLDNLMNLIGELVITRGRLSQLSVTIDDPALSETVAQATRLVADLQDEIMTSRMVPVWQVFDRFPRLVRDAARSVGKSVELVIEGKDVELDRSMLDEVGDPLVHLLRNAVDHGIEAPDVRRAAGKPEQGRLTLSALRDRSAVAIRVSDDGRGIDRERVLRRAIADGIVDQGRTDLGDEELLRLISRAGFSTADTVTDLSGRGVGIDAVYNRVRSLGGSVDIRTAPGEGTTVTLRLPLTLAIVRSLLARIGDETYAVPMTHVRETVELQPAILRSLKGREVLMLRDEVLPVMRLRRVMGFEGPAKRGMEQVVVVEMADRRAGLVVDELIGQQEIVVKQFDGVQDGLSLFGGATILGDGAPALILDVSSLL